MFAACTTHSIQAPIGDRSSSRMVGNPDQHIVRHGDTLYSVAFLYGYPVEDVAGWNRLKAPYTIYKGQRLRLRPPPPGSVSRPQPKTRPIAASQPKPRYPTRSEPKTIATPVAPSKPKSAAVPRSQPKTVVARLPPPEPQNRRLSWAWPVKGPLLKRFKAGGGGKKGIDIGGKSGAPVKAAADGKIVYSGSGLGGYGRLIIIKHNKDFLSAYAHNRTLVAKEGQWVKQGEVIAQMGSSGTDRTRLHFEIRKRGQPVDPLRYLP